VLPCAAWSGSHERAQADQAGTILPHCPPCENGASPGSHLASATASVKASHPADLSSAAFLGCWQWELVSDGCHSP